MRVSHMMFLARAATLAGLGVDKSFPLQRLSMPRCNFHFYESRRLVSIVRHSKLH